jgi:uncharacterized delta-60 repeat protein
MRTASSKFTVALLSVFAIALVQVAGADAVRAGKLDRSFGGDGVALFRVDSSFQTGSGIARTSRGQVILGVFSAEQAGSVVRFRQGGALDRSFGRAGQKRLAFTPARLAARDLLVDRRDRIVVVGEATRRDGGGYLGAVARLLPNGRVDRSFSGDGIALSGALKGSTPLEVALGRDGKVVMVGLVGGTPSRRVFVARFMPNGRPDRGFAGDGYRVLRVGAAQASRSVTIDRRGRTLVGSGSAMKDGGGAKAVFSIFRLTGKGRLDRTFSGDGRVNIDPARSDDQFEDLALDGQGRILAVGSTTGPNGSIIRLSPGGSLDRSFAARGRKTLDMSPGSVSADRKGRVIVVGSMDLSGPTTGSALRLRPNGSVDSSFNTFTGGLSYFSDHFIDGRNRIVASGAKRSRAAGVVRILNP